MYYFCRELPDFLYGIRLCLLSQDVGGEWKRHAIAYGAEVLDVPDEGALVVSEHPVKDQKAVTPLWLIECFRQKKLASKEPYLI